MKFKLFLKRNFYTIRILLIVFGGLIFWYSFYFSDQKLSIDCIPYYLKDYRMYLALIFSILGSLFVVYTVGIFNKENIKRITTLDEDEKDK
mgnify:FL=1|tara:strand:+ start:860 stop:1132 length:273 start_codon:yes stop_codon:yes gene_type:complete